MTEAGEGKNGRKVDPKKSLAAKVIQLEFVDSFKASLKQALIKPPHWPAEKSAANESSKAVVFKFDNKGTQKAKVKIKIISEGFSGNGKLTGIFKQFEFEGSVPLASGEYIVDVTLKEPPTKLTWAKGDIFWGVEATDRSVMAGKTHVEIFFVFADPALQPCFSRSGVWIEALRFLFKRSSVNGVQTKPSAVEKVTQCCFGLPNHKYEVMRGRPSYGGMSGIFLLKNYINDSDGYVNCYDQAYAVITLSAALGIKVDGLYLAPFGYIRTVNLVGWGRCNNPFPGRLPTSQYLVVDPRDPNRSGFGNHMFCEFTAKIYDACAGPVKGNVDRAGYVAATIDTVTPPGAGPGGTAAQMVTIDSMGRAVVGVQ
ncbi:MAG: hypothetical protein B0W54_15215 [Cellvibrio sp. 79]|nr:MAG: hypothetical protein B0W54_15215 [Cellvibrio sp. 79]